MQCCLQVPLADSADERRAMIHDSWQRLGVNQCHVALALPAHQVRYQILSLPHMPEHELDAMLLGEAAQQLALAPHEISFDYQRLPPGSDINRDEIRILLCAASLQDVKQRIKLVEHAGLRVSHLDVESFALLRIGAHMVPWCENSFQRRALLQISDHTYSLHLIPAGALLPEQPAKIFDHTTLDPQASDPLLNLLSTTAPGIVLLAGMRQPVERLSHQLHHLGLTTIVANPLAICASLPETELAALAPEAPTLALSCGLALGARAWQPADNNWLPQINLLPLHAKRRQVHRRRFIALLILCLLLTGALCGASNEWLTRRLRADEQGNRLLKQQIDALQLAPWLPLDPLPNPTDLRWIEQWLARRTHATKILEQLEQATPSGVALTRFQQKGQHDSLSGHALSSDALQRFEQNLRQMTAWDRIDRQSARSAMINQRLVIVFTLHAWPHVEPAP